MFDFRFFSFHFFFSPVCVQVSSFVLFFFPYSFLLRIFVFMFGLFPFMFALYVHQLRVRASPSSFFSFFHF